MKMKNPALLLLFVVIVVVRGRCPPPDDIAPCQCRTRGPSIQVRCVNSMMSRILEAMMNIRNVVDRVDVLILENNNIPHLPSRALGSVKVNRLFLENNRIQTIDRNAFAGVEGYITEIYLKEPGLRQIPTDAIDFLKELTVFSVESSEITEMPRVVGLQKLKLFKIDGSNITDIQDFTLKNLPGLRYLHVTNSKLKRLETGILENLPFLLLANFTGNDISWIHPRSFRYMEQLEQVILAHNSIGDASIVGQAVKVIKTIKTLDISNNRMDKLRERSFVDINSLEELDLSNNNIVLMQRGALTRLPRLKKLDLRSNDIRSFHSDIFLDVPQLMEIDLHDNKISRLSDVSFLQGSVPLLRVLDLGLNLIEDIPYGALRGYPTLEKLVLGWNQISGLAKDAFADLPTLLELDLSRNRLTSENLDGNVFNLRNLQILDLSENKLSRIDRSLLGSLGSLRRLNLAQNGITEMAEDSFQPVRNLDFLNISFNNLRDLSPELMSGLTRLYELDASNNELVTLSDHTFIDQNKLEFLSLAKNQIQLVSSHLFSEFNSLRYLDFSSNFILEFPSAMMRKLRNLDRLIFRKNSIQSLDQDSFKSMVKLELIDLHDNRIEDIHDLAFQDLAGLKSLDLSLNVISTVGASLDPAIGLMKLNLSDNYITTLPFQAFRSLDRLSTLDISNNTIVDIGEAFVNMPELKFLDLSYNHLPSIKSGAFKNLPRLISLHLDHNSVIRIEPNSFQDLWDLERIYLSKNGISTILTDTFRNLPSLEKLYLDDNLIKELDEKSFLNLLSLKELRLEYNLIKTINERAFYRIPSIRNLNLSYNLLQDLSRYGFYGLETLETIDLSFNDIRIIDDRTFENLKWLVHLRLNDNNICQIAGTAFKDTSSLRRLDLNNNRIFKLKENAFTSIQRSVEALDVSGNPLNCDCETKWLRNLVTDRGYYGKAEPRCYFPKALSGSPLRELRSSRFTCDSGSSPLLLDACNSLPLKTPAQLHAASLPPTGVPENLATFEIEFGSETSTPEGEGEISTPSSDTDTDLPTTKPLVDQQDNIIELVNNVVDAELDRSTTATSAEDSNSTNSGDVDYAYEYVYYYYDEDGKNGTVVDTKSASSLIKLNNISVVELPVVAPVSSGIGDTPTIYAGSDIGDEKQDDEDKPEDEKGLSIFGIPIPSLPISLSFGLAPAISQFMANGGLLPLGRKGEASGTEKKDTLGNIKMALNTIKDLTRGPDNQDPVWIDTMKNIDFKKVAAMFPDALSPKQEEIYLDEKDLGRLGGGFGFRPGEGGQYGYATPGNPIIPLSGEYMETPRSSGYFPNQSGELGYFPAEETVPLIKFDHPIHPILLPPSSPVLPPSRNYNTNFGDDGKGGFQPMFIPNTRDQSKLQVQGGQSLREYAEILRNRPTRPAFPEIDATIRYENLETETRKPSLDFTDTTETSGSNLNAVDLNQFYEDYPDFKEPSIFRRSTEAPVITLGTLDEYYDDTETTVAYDPRKSQEKVGNIASGIVYPKQQEHPVKDENSLEIYEVQTKEPINLTPGSTENSAVNIDVTHKGTPKEEAETTTSSSSTAAPEYTYEYEYVYYDEPVEEIINSLDSPSTSTSASTVPTAATEAAGTDATSSLMSLLTYLNSEKTGEDLTSIRSSITEPTSSDTTKRQGPLLPQMEYTPPTPYPPIRTTPGGVDTSYSQNRRSDMQTEERYSRSSSPSSLQSDRARSSSPNPDRQGGPADVLNQENSVNWYYSEYNNQNSEPYIGPGGPGDRSTRSAVDSYHDQFYIYLVLIPILRALVYNPALVV